MSVLRRHRTPTIALLAAVLAAVVAAVVAVSALPGGDAVWAGLLLPGFSFAVVGAMIVLVRPENRMGWIFVAIGALLATGTVADEIASAAPRDQDPKALIVFATWYSEWFWIPWVFLSLVFAILLFPTGRPLSVRWRRFGWVIASAALFLTVAAALDPVIAASNGPDLENPIGISPLGDPDETALGGVFLLAMWGGALGALTSLVLRFRRSRGEEREQLKWFTFFAAIEVVGFILIGTIQALDDVWIFSTIVLSALPIGAGIAILKYRLYDIDVVINRTLVYAGLTAVLVATYAAGVLFFRAILDPVTGDNDLAIAASTLAVAGIFGPARRRIQSFIDRRFYRSRYDAQRTLEAFAARLKDEVGLDNIAHELVDVLARTVQPSHACLWMSRKAEG